MTKIRNIIQINSGYTSYVNLYEDYYDIAKNRGRMERYKPIAAHRQAFEKAAKALNPLDRRFYFLSGSYGTGKSHLLLMIANYFANPSDVPEIETFFKNYESSQRDVLLKPSEALQERSAASLKEARKSGRFLVALCRYDLNLDFEGAIIRALEEALEHDHSEILIDSHYREALRKINEWNKSSNKTHFMTDLESALNRLYPDWTINDLVEGLEHYNDQAFNTFKVCFKDVTSVDFIYTRDNLRDIISDFLKNPKFQEQYKGILILYDEFGAAIDAGLANYSTLLSFAEYCANSSLDRGGDVIFVGSGHKSFRNHGQVGDLNAEVLEARVTEIGLQTQGMEDLIAAVVHPKKESSPWINEVQPKSYKFTNFTVDCNRLQLFNWLPAPKIANNIIQNIYPMHPFATYALIRLASEAGSDNRSVFKFFAPEFDTGEAGWINVQPFSYPWFIENHEIVEQGKLSLYTADLLVEYFKESLKASNTKLTDRVKTAVVNYEVTLRELNNFWIRKSQEELFEERDELLSRILKIMLVNEIVSNQETTITNTSQNIEFALDQNSPDEKNLVENRLKLLCDNGVIYFDQDKGIYELIRGDRKDVRRLVEQFKSNPDNRPQNLLSSFLELSTLRADEVILEAKDYNATYNEDKRLRVVFATPIMLTQEQVINGQAFSFFAALDLDRQSYIGKGNGYEGVAVYVFCETENDINAAKIVATKNDQKRVVIAIPRHPISVFDAIFTMKALQSDWFRAQAQDFGPYENADLHRIQTEAKSILNDAKSAYFNNAKVHWFGIRGTELPARENRRDDVANRMMLELFGAKRNNFGNFDFNKSHINISSSVKAVLKEAVEILCDLSQPIRINWSWSDNRGGIRYLRKCFVDHQALHYLSSEGDNRFFSAEKDVSKFRSALPAYAQLLEDLAKLEGKGPVNFTQFIKVYFEEFGQGEIAVTLMLLLARRYYGDGLRFKREPNILSNIQITGIDDILGLVQRQSPAAVILFEPVSAEDQAYFAKITQLFTNQPAPAGKIYSVSEAYQAIINWWGGLPIIARSLDHYGKDEKLLAEALSQARTKDPFQFIKRDLPLLLGQVPGEVLTTGKLLHIEVYLKQFKSFAEAILAEIEEQVLVKISEIFQSSTHLDVDIQEAMSNWYSGLSSSQTDLTSPHHTNDSKPLVLHHSYANIRELLFEKLPKAYGFGEIQAWLSNYVEPYAQKIQAGKQYIEQMTTLPPAMVIYEQPVSQHGNQVSYKGKLVMHAESVDGDGIIYYTEDGSDPTLASNPQRKQLISGDTLTIIGNRKVKIVVADERGSYSAVKTIDAIDELNKYKITRLPQPHLPSSDETINFIFPISKETAEITLDSLISELKNAGIYTDEDLIKLFDHIIAKR